MQDELDTTIREAIDSLYPSLDDVAPNWERVVADASPTRRRSEPARPQRLRRSRRYLVRGALFGAAAAAVALGGLSGLPGDGLFPGTGPSTIARAANALTPPDNTILHTVVVTTQRRPDGDTAVWKTETWQQTSPPTRPASSPGASSRRQTAPFSTTTRERTPSTPRRRTPSLPRRWPSPPTRASASACSTSCARAKHAKTAM
jgi:hypothetical protein